MAKQLVISSADELAKQIRQLATDLREKVMAEALNAGADVLVELWKDKIEEKYHVVTGDMLDSVNKTAPKLSATSATIEVYPMGTDSHRVRNSTKAAVINYGREGRGRIVGDHFVDEIDAEAEQKCNAAMQAVVDRYTSGKD